MQASLLRQKSFQLYLDQMIVSLSGLRKDLGKIFSGLVKKASTYIFRVVSKNVSVLISVRYYKYDTITLKLFVEVINSGEFERIARSKVYDAEKCLECWEQILVMNSRQEGTNRLGITFDSFKAYIRYSAVFVMVNAMLTKLQFIVDKDVVEELAGLGYNIKMTKEGYAPSIQTAFNKLRNINSKIASKQIELEALIKGGDGEIKSGLDFGGMIAEVSTALGFQISKDVLLSEYNSYVKLIRAKKS